MTTKPSSRLTQDASLALAIALANASAIAIITLRETT
jgi:hypothetical protein|tara:strand:+ start:6659 stop:6769 length:111 start_codon:yes stop_codon:yes gene_type:complete